jgi:hypothetical protein
VDPTGTNDGQLGRTGGPGAGGGGVGHGWGCDLPSELGAPVVGELGAAALCGCACARPAHGRTARVRALFRPSASPLARGVACARVRSPAALRVPAAASLEGQLGIPVMWVTWWLPTSRAPPPGRGPEEGRKLLHSAHARREAWAPWHSWRRLY